MALYGVEDEEVDAERSPGIAGSDKARIEVTEDHSQSQRLVFL